MAVEKIFTAGSSYDPTAIDVSSYIPLISQLGVTQLQIYYKVSTGTTYTKLDKASWKDTYNSSTGKLSLSAATVTADGSTTPVTIVSATHDVKLKRETASEMYISFSDGAKLSASDLVISHTQALHKIEEETFYSNSEDADLETLMNSLHALQYLKTEIDDMFLNLSVPNWAAAKNYLVGDVVLHDDPNTAASTVLIWYAGVDHLSASGNQPSATGTGSSYWTVVNPSNSLDNLAYIRKNPGLESTPVDWNLITPQANNVSSLVIRSPISPASGVKSLILQNYTGSTAVNALEWGGTSNDVKVITDLRVTGNSHLSNQANAYASLGGHNWTGSGSNPTGGGSNPPFMWASSDGTTDIFNVYDSSNNEKFSIDASGNVDASRITVGSFYAGSGPFEVHGSDGFIGTLGLLSSGDYMIVEKSILVGENSGTSGDPFTTFFKIDNTKGNIFSYRIGGSCSGAASGGYTADCDITSRYGDVSAQDITANASTGIVSGRHHKFANSSMYSKSVLGTDSSGYIVEGSASPSINKIAYNASQTQGTGDTEIADNLVVYLNKDSGLWTKAGADSIYTLGMGVVDNKSGTTSITFNVVFCGEVGGFSSLTPGQWYWLETDAGQHGAVTATQPSTSSGTLVDPIGVAVTATTLFVVPARPHQVT